jgi:predicted glutamine amidotransferase
MCRLLGVVSPVPVSVRSALGSRTLSAFASLSRLHQDGWGGAWLDGTGTGLRANHSTRQADQDPDFAARTCATRSRAMLLHLRWASGGMATAIDNVHPFVADDLAFAHNGYIAPAHELDSGFGVSGVGTTDSERYFEMIRAGVAAGDTPEAAVESTVARLRDSYPLASLNALLLTPEQLIIVCASSASVPDIAGMVEAGFAPDALPPEHRDRYYEMRVRRLAGGGLAVASSGLGAAGWTTIPQESVSVVDLGTGAMRTRPVVTRWAA